nr:YncE family protein [Segetibacter sp.]
MKLLAFVLLFLGCYTISFAQTLEQLEQKRVKLPNGWSLTPVGKSLPLGDLPLNMAVSPNQEYVAVTNNGQSVQSIQLFDVKQQKQLDAVTIPKSWYGLSFSSNGKYLYASGGNDNRILKYDVSSNKLRLTDSLVLGTPWPTNISPSGLVSDDRNNLLYVVTKEDNTLYVFNIQQKKIAAKYQLPGEAYTCVLSPQKNELYITCWGCDELLIFDTKARKFKQPVKLGDNPNEMVLSKNGRFAYVCNGNENTVSVIDLDNNLVIETLNSALYPDAPNGSTPNGLALSADEKTLYIANATNNCLAVFDVSKQGMSKAEGFIPVGWYPTNVKVIGKNIWVANGKGFT